MIWNPVRIALLLVTVLVALTLGACSSRQAPAGDARSADASATSEGSRRTSGAGGAGVRSSARDQRSLDELADAELSRKPASVTAGPREVPVPPGVEPAALARRAADDPRAFLTVDEALAALVPPQPQATTQEGGGINRPEITPEQEAAALKAYTKARSAALDNRHLQAITEFQKAYAIDPTSPQVLREMARSYDALGNPVKALELLEQLVQVDPDDFEALFAIGIAAGSRRDFDKAIEHLGRFRSIDKSFRHDPAADILADFTLAMALRELGYDRASIAMARRAVDFEFPRVNLTTGRLASVYRQRGDTWRAIGDAHCRLGEFEDALVAYEASASLPSADPSALHPRVIYANLQLSRPYNAQRALLRALRGEGEATIVSDRNVRLCGYLAETAQPVDRLAAAVIALHEANPQESGYVRAAALLLPPERATALLRSFIDERPRDLQALSQLLEWAAQDDVSAAAALAVSLAADHPDMAEAYAERLAFAAPVLATTLAAVEAQPASAVRAVVQSRLLSRAGALGPSWDVCQAALKQWPRDRALRLRAVELAADMREPALVNRAIEVCADIDDAAGLIILAKVRRAMSQTQPALELAQRAATAEPESVEAQIELAQAHLGRASVLAAEGATAVDVRTEAEAAIAASNRALELDPQRDEPYLVLALVYGSGGPLADSRELDQTLARLQQSNPHSPLLARLAAQRAITQRRFDQALERAISAYDGNPSDAEALAIAVNAWQGAGKLDEAERWLREKLAQRSGDRLLRENLTVVQVRRNQAELAARELEQAIAADAQDWVGRRLLEDVYRATGQPDSALELGEKRLLALPEGIRRELELAVLYANAELADKALERLERVRELANDGSLEDLAGALAIAGRIEGNDARRDALALDLVNVTLERYPNAPLQVYGAALRAAARAADDEPSNARFDELVRQAIAQARGASDPSIAGARQWHDLCQALVSEGAPGAAAQVLRIRMSEGPAFETPLLALLARMTVVLDAAAAYDAEHERNDRDAALAQTPLTVALVNDMEKRGLLQRIFDTPQPCPAADGMYEASVLYNIIGSEAGSEALLREALRLQADHAMALNNLGYMLLERSDAADPPDEVTQMIERSHALEPLEHNILDTLGWLRYKQGRFADDTGDDGQKAPGARTLIQQAMDGAAEPSPEVFDHLGDVCWRLGDKDAALEAWGRVVSLLEDGSFRERLLQNIAALQATQWQMIVMDGERLYDREYGGVLARAQAKIAAARRGEQPAVAPIFGE